MASYRNGIQRTSHRILEVGRDFDTDFPLLVPHIWWDTLLGGTITIFSRTKHHISFARTPLGCPFENIPPIRP